MTATGLKSLLQTGADELGIALDATQQEQLLRLLTELADWNTRINLTAIRDPEDMVRKHLLDSLSMQPYLHGQTVADVGSGAGFPGLPLAVVNPSRRFALVESTGKKSRFIQHAIEMLQLPNAEAVNVRAEAWWPPQAFDTVISRALGNLRDFVRFSGHLCAPHGRLLAMKGRHPGDEMKALPREWQVETTHVLRVPGLDADRHLVVLTRRDRDRE